jgi:hypothetical protein
VSQLCFARSSMSSCSSSTAKATGSLRASSPAASLYTVPALSTTTAAGAVHTDSAEFPLAGANYQELLPLMAQVDALQAKLKWIDHCCAFHTWGCLTWQQLAVLTVGFHPFPPLSILWVRRLVARTSLMRVLPMHHIAAAAPSAPSAAGRGYDDASEVHAPAATFGL